MVSSNSKNEEDPSSVMEMETQSGFRMRLDSVPVRIDGVRVIGLSRTKEDFVIKEVMSLMTAKNFHELLLQIGEVKARLEKLGCFREIEIMLETSQPMNRDNGNYTDITGDEGYEVTYKVKEYGRLVGSVNTAVGSNDATVSFGCQFPNLGGRGERLKVEHVIGGKQDCRTSTFSFMKTLDGWWNGILTWSLFHRNASYSAWSRFQNYTTGSLFDFSFNTSKNRTHSLQYEGVWRKVYPEASASWDVRQKGGNSFKSSLRHSVTQDNRDGLIFPNSGHLFKLVNEIAGLGGDVAFLKHEAEAQLNFPFPYGVIFQGSARCGVLHSILGSSYTGPQICDQFFTGGPLTLRGFQTNSIGPRSGNDALGGKAYWASGVHLYSPLPFVKNRSFNDYFRLHCFLNAGNVSTDTLGLLDNFRASGGVGVAVRLGIMARMELNYCWPLKRQGGDKVVKGLQFGLGLEFL